MATLQIESLSAGFDSISKWTSLILRRILISDQHYFVFFYLYESDDYCYFIPRYDHTVCIYLMITILLFLFIYLFILFSSSAAAAAILTLSLSLFFIFVFLMVNVEC